MFENDLSIQTLADQIELAFLTAFIRILSESQFLRAIVWEFEEIVEQVAAWFNYKILILLACSGLTFGFILGFIIGLV